VFRSMFQTDFKEVKEGESNVDLTEAGLEAFLKFVYYSDVADAVRTPEVALELLEAGHKYDILSLETSMQDVFLQQSADWFKDKVEILVRLFLWTLKLEGYEQLKQRVVLVMKS